MSSSKCGSYPFKNKRNVYDTCLLLITNKSVSLNEYDEVEKPRPNKWL
jgi:hypothetical protein